MEEVEKKKYKYMHSYFTFQGRSYDITGKTQREADRKADAKLAALKRGEIGTSGKMTVSRWCDEWLETYKEAKVGQGQYENYTFYLGLIKKAIGSVALADVKDIALQKILNQRAAEKKRSKSDLTKLRMAMKALFKRARISRLISYDPAEDLELPAAKDGKIRSITKLERSQILKLAETHYAGLWIKVALYCGIRPGEARALDWRHVDFKRALLHVEQAMKARTKTVDEPKTEAGVRDIPIPDKLLKDLKSARGEPFDPVFKKEDRPHDTREHLPQATGRHDKASMERMWRSFKRELNIANGAIVKRNKIIVATIADDLVPYCLRHTYGTDLQDAGVQINVAKYLMGHSSIAVTANIYTDTTDDAIQDAAKKINKRISAQ